MANGDDDRFDELEIMAAHQARLLEDLNETVVRQAKEIERLERLVEALIKRFQSVEEHLQADIPVTKPPHW